MDGTKVWNGFQKRKIHLIPFNRFLGLGLGSGLGLGLGLGSGLVLF